MKKTIIALLTVSTLALGTVSFADVPTDVKVYIDKSELKFDVNPFIENGRTLVPMRKIFEELGCCVDYSAVDGEEIITANRLEQTIVLKIGENTMYVNSKEIPLDVPAKIVNDRTFVPVRAVSEALSEKVYWNEDTCSVEIEKSHGEHFIKVKSISEYDDKYSIYISYPYIENDNDEVITKLNNEFEANAKKSFEKAQNDMKEYFHPEISAKMTHNETFKVDCDKNGVLSISTLTYDYLGGAHGSTLLKTLNYDLISDKKIELCDILGLEKEELADLVYDNFKELLAKEGFFDEIWDEALKENAQNVNFSLNGDKVYLYFNRYDVAPYAYGIPKIELTPAKYEPNYSELMDIVASTEVGTAGCTLKARNRLAEIAKWFNKYAPGDELNEGVASIIGTIPPNDLKSEYDIKFKLIRNAFVELTSADGYTERDEELSRLGITVNDLINAARFIAAYDNDCSLIMPTHTPYDDNATFTAKVTGVKDGAIKAELFSNNVYDAVEISKMKNGDILVCNNGVIYVNDKKADKDIISVNGGLEKMGVWLKPNGGGTYIETMFNDFIAKTSLGEYELEVLNDVVLTDTANLEIKEPVIIKGSQEVLKSAEKEEFNYAALEFVIKDGKLAEIKRSYCP